MTEVWSVRCVKGPGRKRSTWMDQSLAAFIEHIPGLSQLARAGGRKRASETGPHLNATLLLFSSDVRACVARACQARFRQARAL